MPSLLMTAACGLSTEAGKPQPEKTTPALHSRGRKVFKGRHLEGQTPEAGGRRR